MTGALQQFLTRLDPLPLSVYPPRPRGHFCAFLRQEPRYVLGRPTYTVLSRRGGFALGHVEFRNQWQDWSFTPHRWDDTPLNAEILAEIVKMISVLRGLKG